MIAERESRSITPVRESFRLTPEQESIVFLVMPENTTFSAVKIPSAAVLGQHIRAARLRKGLTQRELAKRLYCSQRWITEIENGKDTAQIGKLLTLCQHLDLQIQLTFASKPDHLVGRRQQKPENNDDGYPSLETIMGENS